MNIASLLAAVKDPERPALFFPGAEKTMVTFRELDDLSSRLAAGMQAEGLRAKDRVIVLAPISLLLYASLIALFKSGATAVFLDPQTRYRQFNRAVALADARALIGTRKFIWLKALSPALRQVPYIFLTQGDGARSFLRMARSFSPRMLIADVNDDTPALITFTGGSTDSSPRGVLRTHRLLIAQHCALSRILPMHETDVDLPAFPVATLHNLASGITSVIPDFPFRRPDAV
ncbi:MAG TPA: AMP-binding protein, partial [Anaerolineales bacterium]|nr:AMP-binding protein [Anaerolineales bacterium]